MNFPEESPFAHIEKYAKKAEQWLKDHPKPQPLVHQAKDVNSFDIDEIERELQDALDAFKRGNNLAMRDHVNDALDRVRRLQR